MADVSHDSAHGSSGYLDRPTPRSRSVGRIGSLAGPRIG
ncbi:hypothetical protein Rhow_006833 [Rhodococcus wratislaviensis]|uniref:Uncharacterized protein n=1 Tax=Rhodococcus wratislaviensis TaxID=44752 RepID=A0A402CGK5_RHOWR|nr:hypothetical protein Rhow_006833 [Rhodococcus wratislaviensis]